MTKERKLHAGVYVGYGYLAWFEHGKDWEFTKRIKYTYEYGEFKEVYFEITWEETERHWYSFWRENTVKVTRWIPSERFKDMYPHRNFIEENIVECET